MNIHRYLGKSFHCKYCHQLHTIPTKRITAKPNAINGISEFIHSLFPTAKNLVVLCDTITYGIAGKECETRLKRRYQVSTLILAPQHYSTVYADSHYFPRIRRIATSADGIVTVGTGSITDMGKYIGTELNIPVISVPTAPSMNAYTSGVSAFIDRGIKRTVPVSPALGVLIDTDLITTAPLDLIQAGFADTLAKAFANADWQISSILTGESFCLLPSKLFTAVEKHYKTQGDKLLQRDKKTILALMDALNLGGFSMVIAGKSAPASGGEHLISHFLDMEAHRRKQDVFAYHGLQVGIGVIQSARLYEQLKKIKSPQHNTIDYDRTIAQLFGSNTNRINQIFKYKLPYLKHIQSRWEQLSPIFAKLPSSKEIIHYLKKAKCPTTFAEIGVDKPLAIRTIVSARYIRDRITVFDIADELGILQEIIV
ncbi:MAG: iron-containing alcohol dehydrogenase [bacterium]|nr:iron-containing alcohol dehydrogenase [bacterium]